MIRKKSKTEIVQGYFFMVVACICYALSTSLFLAPNTIISGGISGLSVMLNYVNGKLPIGLMSIALNIPILALGLKFCGLKFVLKCLLTVSVLGVFTDLFANVPAITDDSILASLYGGVCQGIAIGLFVKYEFSSGGTEILARVVCTKLKFMKINVCVAIWDALVVIFGAIVTKNPNNLLYALIVIFVYTKVSEPILTGLEKSKLCIIVTDKGKELSETLVKNSPRGVTMLQGKGMYTGNDHNVVLTCVKNRQLTALKQMVKSVDEHAFIIINDSVEVRGQGFQQLEE